MPRCYQLASTCCSVIFCLRLRTQHVERRRCVLTTGRSEAEPQDGREWKCICASGYRGYYCSHTATDYDPKTDTLKMEACAAVCPRAPSLELHRVTTAKAAAFVTTFPKHRCAITGLIGVFMCADCRTKRRGSTTR